MQQDSQRAKLFHLASPALEITARPNIHSSVFHDLGNLQPSLFVDRFNPTTRNTDAWFSMNWNPSFAGRHLTTELAQAPTFSLIQSERVRNFDPATIIGAYLGAYLDAFPVTNRAEVLALFQRGGDYRFTLNTLDMNANDVNSGYLRIMANYEPQDLYQEMMHQEGVSFEAYTAARDRYEAACRSELIHYVTPPTREALETFWRNHGLYNSFYELKLNLFSYIPN